MPSRLDDAVVSRLALWTHEGLVPALVNRIGLEDNTMAWIDNFEKVPKFISS